MAFIKLRGISEMAGVDIGTSSIKVCAVKSTSSGFKLLHAVKRLYQDDLLSEGNIIDRDFVSREIKSIFSENKIKTKYVASALSSYAVITKVVNLPFLEGSDLESSISFEVENAIPFPLSDVYYSHYVLGLNEAKQDTINIQIAAAKKEIVDGYRDVFKMAGLNLRILDVDMFDITNLVEQTYSPQDVSALIIDIGASITNMAIMRDSNIQFTREILMGGKYLTRQIQKSLQLSQKEAEEKKIAGDEAVSYLFDDFIYNISSEINKTINFYISIKPKEAISKIYLTGGSSQLKGLKDQIAEDTRIPVEYLNPFLLLDQANNETFLHEQDMQYFSTALYLSSRMTDIEL